MICELLVRLEDVARDNLARFAGGEQSVGSGEH
jgi:hypothetical protein